MSSSSQPEADRDAPSVDHAFEFGIVMAGAVSAGAYSAGVLDFLVEALDAYYEARDKPGWSGPTHDVRLRVITGTSAGGITAALGAGCLFREFSHLAEGASEPATNPLYDAWVEEVDISRLLATADLEADGPILSLLDSTVLDTIAREAIGKIAALEPKMRHWVEDPLTLYLTSTNLRGLPYGFDIFARGKTTTFGMMSHADEIAFAIGTSTPATRHVVPIDAVTPDPASEGWELLVEAALATGAFPIGLAARRLTSPTARYHRRPLLPEPVFGDVTWKSDTFAFSAVDGGVIDNEPIEIARQCLSGGPDKHNPRSGDEASRAVVLVDPFPNEINHDPDAFEDRALVPVAMRLLAAMKNQARFKREEMDLAIDSEVYSRFMISPSRRIDDTKERHPVSLATGQLGGFSGFFARAYRHHDYLLGRRNCQSFLMRYFALPETNRLFDTLGQDARDQWYARERDGSLRQVQVSQDDTDRRRALPIIPVVPQLRADIEIPDEDVPPAGTAAVDLGAVEVMIARRVDALTDRALDAFLTRRWYRPDHAIARWFARRKVRTKAVEMAMTSIRSGLSLWR